MELEIEIPEKLYEQLESLAAKRKTSAGEIVAEVIRKFFERSGDRARG